MFHTLKYLLWADFFIVIVLPVWGHAENGEALLSQERTFFDTKYSYDRNADGKVDHWKIVTPSGALRIEELDINSDGKPDYKRKNTPIKNLIEIVQDKNIDDEWDHYTLELPLKKYTFIDKDFDGIYDNFLVFKKDLNQGDLLICSEEIHEEVRPSLITFLKTVSKTCSHELSEVVEVFSKNYLSLETLLDSALEDPYNHPERWEELLRKTRMALDLPSDEVLPAKIILEKSEDTLIDMSAFITLQHDIHISPSRFKDNLPLWLATLSHELLHAHQFSTLFDYLKKFSSPKDPLWNMSWSIFISFLGTLYALPSKEELIKVVSIQTSSMQWLLAQFVFYSNSHMVYEMLIEVEANYYEVINFDTFFPLAECEETKWPLFGRLTIVNSYSLCLRKALSKPFKTHDILTGIFFSSYLSNEMALLNRDIVPILQYMNAQEDPEIRMAIQESYEKIRKKIHRF